MCADSPRRSTASFWIDLSLWRVSGLWDPVDEFYHDVLLERRRGGADVRHPLRVVSMVGLVPLFAATRVKAEVLNQFPELKDALATASKETQFVSGELFCRQGFVLKLVFGAKCNFSTQMKRQSASNANATNPSHPQTVALPVALGPTT